MNPSGFWRVGGRTAGGEGSNLAGYSPDGPGALERLSRSHSLELDHEHADACAHTRTCKYCLNTSLLRVR